MNEEKIRMIMDKILDRLMELDMMNPFDVKIIIRCHRRFKILSQQLKSGQYDKFVDKLED